MKIRFSQMFIGASMALSFFAMSGTAHAASLTQQQVSAIINLLNNFGADPIVVGEVNATLGGTPLAARALTSLQISSIDSLLSVWGVDTSTIQKVNGYLSSATVGAIIVSSATAPTAMVNVANFSGGLDTAVFSIPFTVTASNTGMYVGNKTTRLSSPFVVPSGTATGVNYATTTTSTQGTATGATTLPVATLAASGLQSLDTPFAYYVPANSSRTFTLSATASASSSNTAGKMVGMALQLVGINYGPSSTLGSQYYTNVSSFQTPLVYVQKH